jgi:hypothetical protein
VGFDPVSSLLDIGGKLIDKLLPDPAAKAAASQKLLEMQQQGDLARMANETQLAQMQAAINEQEAKSTNWFVAGGRPGAIWVCVLIFFCNGVLGPFVTFFAHRAFPVLDAGFAKDLLVLLLGLGAYRSFEKYNDVAGNH